MINFDVPEDFVLESCEDLRVHRLQVAVARLHEMRASEVRDQLIRDLDAVIGRILSRVRCDHEGEGMAPGGSVDGGKTAH